jgi:hypothetical protein
MKTLQPRHHAPKVLLLTSLFLCSACWLVAGAEAGPRIFSSKLVSQPSEVCLAFSNKLCAAFATNVQVNLPALVLPAYRAAASKLFTNDMVVPFRVADMQFAMLPSEAEAWLRSDPRFAQLSLTNSQVLWCALSLTNTATGASLGPGPGFHVACYPNKVEIIAPWVGNQVCEPAEAAKLLETAPKKE